MNEPESERAQPEHGRALLAGFIAGAPPPPPGDRPAARLLYGFAQPILGAKRLLDDPVLMNMAMTPVMLLAGFCAVVAYLRYDSDKGALDWLRSFYETFSYLAPLPSILFGPHYARLAAQAHRGFGRACEPKLESVPRSIRRAIQKSIIVALGGVPLAIVSAFEPVGPVIAGVLGALWALQWIVVEAFDDAQVLAPGETLADADRATLAAPVPWFVRGLSAAARRSPPVVRGLLRASARITDRFSLSWREEIERIEKERITSVGFAAATAVLLATPILNLFFRPVIIVAASHLLGQSSAEGEREVA